MRIEELLTMYGRELDELAELNGLDSRKEAMEAARHEMYAQKNLFGYRPFYKLPDGFDLDQFERDLGRVFVI